MIADMSHPDHTVEVTLSGNRVVVSDDSGLVRCWLVRDSEGHIELESEWQTEYAGKVLFRWHASADGETYAGECRKTLILRDRSGCTVATLEHDDLLVGSAFAMNDTRIYTCELMQGAYGWDVPSGRRVWVSPERTVTAVEFGPGIMARSASDNTTTVCSHDGTARFTLPYSFSAAGFSPDGKRLAIADGTRVRVIDSTTGDEVGVRAAGAAVAKVRFACGDRYLAAVIGDVRIAVEVSNSSSGVCRQTTCSVKQTGGQPVT